VTQAPAPPAIVVRDLRKRFVVSRDRPESLKSAAVQLFRRRTHHSEVFWALDGVSFDVHQGEVLGLIGPNGSGKSTLLGLLSRILRPTGGTVEARGRVCTLLELGAGFHPELTGIENIYLNGVILGLSRAEVSERIESIVAFAELGDFIESPVRTYSSGMVTRLGFAVAVHVEPDILLIDEVLAVGDERFTRKCYAKMNEFRADPRRTLILVSHDLEAVGALCTRVMWLERGRIVELGEASDVLEHYLAKHGGHDVG